VDRPGVDICRLTLGELSQQDRERIKRILEYKRIAIVGLSPKQGRASRDVAEFLLEKGYTLIPVRPGVKEILGLKCYPDLEAIDVPVDIVDVFRQSKYCPEIARKALNIGAKVLWLQEGIVSKEAERIARSGGMEVVMDLCIKKAYQELMEQNG